MNYPVKKRESLDHETKMNEGERKGFMHPLPFSYTNYISVTGLLSNIHVGLLVN